MGLKKRKYRLDNVSGKYLWFLWSFIFCNIAVTAVSPGNTTAWGEENLSPWILYFVHQRTTPLWTKGPWPLQGSKTIRLQLKEEVFAFRIAWLKQDKLGKGSSEWLERPEMCAMCHLLWEEHCR